MAEYDTILSKLRQIHPTDGFEPFIADLWGRQGWQTKVTKNSKDRGVDVIAEKESPVSRRQVIQTKLNAKGNKVGRPEIQQYNSLKNQEPKPDVVIVITTSSFTRDAEKAAENLNVKLVSGKELVDIIAKTDSSDLLRKYTESTDKNLKQRRSGKSDSERLTDKLEKLRREANKRYNKPEKIEVSDCDINAIGMSFQEDDNVAFDSYLISYTSLMDDLAFLGLRDRSFSDVPSVKNIHIFYGGNHPDMFHQRMKLKTAAEKCGFVVLDKSEDMFVIGEPADRIPDDTEIIKLIKKLLLEIDNISLDDVDFLTWSKD